jgi:hypothetical protein
MPKLDATEAQAAARRLADGTMKLSAAAEDRIEQYRSEVDEVLLAIEELSGVRDIWVSDKSRLGDFGIAAKLDLLDQRFGVTAARDTLVWEFAERVRRKRSE